MKKFLSICVLVSLIAAPLGFAKSVDAAKYCRSNTEELIYTGNDDNNCICTCSSIAPKKACPPDTTFSATRGSACGDTNFNCHDYCNSNSTLGENAQKLAEKKGKKQAAEKVKSGSASTGTSSAVGTPRRR